MARVEVSGLGPADLLRLGEILAVLARHGVIVVARHGTTIAIRPRARGGRAFAVALRRSFADLGPTFGEFGQLIASSPGLFPARLSDECQGVIVHGCFHGDVHAGNLFATPDGRVVFLDFGITGRIASGVRDVLRDVPPAIIVDGDVGRVVDGLFAVCAPTGPIDRATAAADLDALATSHRIPLPRELVLAVKQLLHFERDAKAIARDHQILADPALLALLRRVS